MDKVMACKYKGCRTTGKVNVIVVMDKIEVPRYRCTLCIDIALDFNNSHGYPSWKIEKKQVCCGLILCKDCLKNARECVSF